MIGLVQVGAQAYADRYTYFPSLGLGFVATLGLADAARCVRLPRPAVTLAACAFLAALGVATWRQTLVWRNTVELLEHALTATGHNWMVRLFLAEELAQHNELRRAEMVLQQAQSDGAPPSRIHMAMSGLYDREYRDEDALREIDAALALEPNDFNMLVNRGLYLAKLRCDAEAVVVLKQAIALDSGNDPKQLDIARHTLAAAQRRLAQVPPLQGKCDGF